MPIFMVGTQRSGSNFLRLILNQSDQLAAPHPPHIIDRMVPLLPLYENMGRSAMTEALMNDVCDLVDANPVPWYDHPIDRKMAWRHLEGDGLIAVFDSLYKQYAVSHGAIDWVCKSLANINHMSLIHNYYRDEEKYIYLYRDGRDVALSLEKAIVGEKHIYMIAQQWRQDQRKAIAFCQEHKAKIFPIAYESLIRDMDEILEPLCEFIGISYDDRMHNYYNSEEAERTAKSGTSWANVIKPVMKENSNKFVREMSQERIRIFESVAGDELSELGYDFHSRKSRVVFDEEQIRHFQKENEKLKKTVKLKLTAEELEKRDIQSRVLERIRVRRQSGGS